MYDSSSVTLNWGAVSRDPFLRRDMLFTLRKFFKKRFPRCFNAAMNDEEMLRFSSAKRRRRVYRSTGHTDEEKECYRRFSCLYQIPDDIRYWFSPSRRARNRASLS